eukprot:jgi/Tetstr1/428565/TSEL_018559.t1
MIAPGAPGQEAEEAVVEATDRAEGVVEASEAALAPPAPQPPAGHADLLVAMLTGALRAVAEAATCTIVCVSWPDARHAWTCGQRTDWECCCDGPPAFRAAPSNPCHGRPIQRAKSRCPTTATKRADFRHVKGRVPRRTSRRRV